jgi:tRNA nucleotidyltransferase (CCA-adding enzyme)
LRYPQDCNNCHKQVTVWLYFDLETLPKMPTIDLRSFFVSPQAQIVQMAAAIARSKNFKLYVVGGVVRDRLLALLAANQIEHNQAAVAPEFLSDIDLVVEGKPRASIEVAIALYEYLNQQVENQQLEPDYGLIRLQAYEKFQTAELYWQNFADFGSFTLDLATARQEIYAYPGANPQVKASSIEQDLYRRDLTINAFAIEIIPWETLRDLPVAHPASQSNQSNQTNLSNENAGAIANKTTSESIEATDCTQTNPDSTVPPYKREVIDLFGGYADMLKGQIRTIRPGSFAEDPRRIFRAVRFAQRFGFAIAPDQEAEILATTASGQHDQIGGNRLRSELNYILDYDGTAGLAAKILRSLEDLGALRCIHPQLHLPTDFSWQLRRLCKWLVWFAEAYPIRLAGVELLVSYLPWAHDQPTKQAIAQLAHQLEQLNIGLTAEQIKRQGRLRQLEQALHQLCLSRTGQNSQDANNLNATQQPDQQISQSHNLNQRSAQQSPNPDLKVNQPAGTSDLIKPSQVVAAIERYDPVAMAIAAARIGNPTNDDDVKNALGQCQLRLLWQYLTKWQQVKSPLSGNDLKKLGFTQGRTIGMLLKQLRAARLDGQIDKQVSLDDNHNGYEAALRLLAQIGQPMP